MQILMIGNGFDIEHKLPTQYKDFLQFTEEFLKIYASGKRKEEIEKIGDADRKRFFEKIFSDCDGKLRENLNNNLKQNLWINYFIIKKIYKNYMYCKNIIMKKLMIF